MLRCSQGNCRAIPVASCFARPNGWQFTAKHAKTMRQHVALHSKFAPCSRQLLEVADKVTRTEEGSFACSCGMSGTVGKIAKHRCQTEKGLLRRVNKRRKHQKSSANGSYWCVKKKDLKTRLHVLQLQSLQCPEHQDTCWRVVRRQGKPLCVLVKRTKLTHGGALLYPRPAAKTCPLAKRCYARELPMKQDVRAAPSPLENFLHPSQNAEKEHNQISQRILEFDTLPQVCPRAVGPDQTDCRVIKRAFQDSVRIVTSQGVFIARRRKYSCSPIFPMKDQFNTQKVQGHLIDRVLVDDSFWSRAWRLWVETEDWCCLQRDLRSVTSDRIAWALRGRADVHQLQPPAQAALRESLMQDTGHGAMTCHSGLHVVACRM